MIARNSDGWHGSNWSREECGRKRKSIFVVKHGQKKSNTERCISYAQIDKLSYFKVSANPHLLSETGQ